MAKTAEHDGETGFDRLGGALLRLHRLCAAVPSAEFQDRALGVVRALIPFDSAMWGEGAIGSAGVVVLAMHLDRQPPEMPESYERIKQHDAPAADALSHLGVTQVIALDAPRRTFHPDAVAHARRFGMFHTMTTVITDPVPGIFAAVALYRADPANPFSEQERQFKQALTPHLFETWSSNRLSGPAGQTALHAAGGARALSDRRGWLRAISPDLVDLLRVEWPGWTGPVLPAPLVRSWIPVRSSSYRGAAVLVRSEPLDDLLLVTARPLSKADSLTPRELEVARQFAAGSSYRSIARALGIAPATVRNHLSAVYQKLAVDNKVALGRALDGGVR